MISGLGVGGRTPFPTDALQQRLVKGSWQAPKAGDQVTSASGEKKTWTAIKANKEGWFEDDALSNAYVYIAVESPNDRVAYLVAQGDSAAYINGEIRPGDPYQYGYLQLPIRLKSGRNDLLFPCGRGRLRVEIKDAPSAVFINPGDYTLPDLIVGEKKELWMSAVLTNGTGDTLTGYKARTKRPDGKTATTALPDVLPMSIRKVPVKLLPGDEMKPGDATYLLEILDREGKVVDSKEVKLRARAPLDTHKRTFVSAIDGSVQYYAVVPAQKPSDQNVLVMSLHGASVEALGQAEAYSAKDWSTLVAPTNRRPFGFDWEDWGRLDFLEVFGRAKQELKHDPARVMLTGHSMGGHGTWSVGSTFPGEFAAIGPSAGWISFWTYVGAYTPKNPQDPMEAILRRAQNSSDTTAFRSNLFAPEIYVLHGDADDNVPVTEARAMRDYLAGITNKVGYYEEKGAGHWWDKPGPGADCVDWAPMFSLFKRATIPDHALTVDFTTVNPAISSTFRWVSILQQEQSLAPSRVRFEPPVGNVLSGKTQNVACFSINYDQPQLWGTGLMIDGQTMVIPTVPRGQVTFRKTNGRWLVQKPPTAKEKSSERSGPLKQAFQRNMLFVYGTRGTLAENQWAFNKARFDAEGFYYRGNGSVDVIPDTNFKASNTRDRNVILYGNADTNSAWKSLLGDSPIQVRREGLGIGGKLYAGDDMACLFVRPRSDNDDGLVAVVSGTGLTGLRLTERMPYFLAGCEYPDWVVFTPDVLQNGPAAAKAAGFFDNRWRIDPQQSAYK